MKTFLASLTLLFSATPVWADSAPPPPKPNAPTAPTSPSSPNAKPADKVWSKITVQSVKPTLTERHVLVIRGMHANGVRGGWTVETGTTFNKNTKVVQIKLAASAPPGSPTTRNLEALSAKVSVTELATAAAGTYDVVIVDQTGKEIGRTQLEKKS